MATPLYNRSALTGGTLLARNTFFTIIGEGAPLLLGLVAIPILVHELGVDRYGILTLSYLVVGYLGLFDLGLGRAATQQISDAIGSNELDRVPTIFWTAFILMFILGMCAAVVVIAASHWLAYTALKIPPAMRSESVGVFVVLGSVLPFVLSGSCASGTLASFQRFDLTTAVGAANGVYSFGAPLVVLIFTHNLIWIVTVLVVGRLAVWAVSLILCVRLVPGLSDNIRPSRDSVRPLLSFGGWVTVTGIAGPLMVYFDRFLIGSMLSIAAVSYYAVPYQIANKLPMLPSAMAGVLFPAFSATVRTDPSRAALLFDRATRYAFMTLVPGVLVLFFFAKELLTLFFGSAFASHGDSVLRWLSIGILMNGLSTIPYGMVQAANRPDLTAKFHLAEVPIYFLALFLLLPRFGVAGVAAAWALRVTIDAILLYMAVAVILPGTKVPINRLAYLSLAASAAIVCGALLASLNYRIICACVLLLIYAVIGWYRVLDSTDRTMLLEKGAAIRTIIFAPSEAA